MTPEQEALEAAYVAARDPRQQSGFSGDEQRWHLLRRPIADAVERSGSFLDVGCANGYLLQSVLTWSAEAGHALVPWGIDVSPKLIALAKERLPGGSFAVADVNNWEPPRRFTYVRTELVYAEDAHREALVSRLLESFLEPEGRLLACSYIGRVRDGLTLRLDVDEELRAQGRHVERVLHGYDADRRELTRVAVVAAT